MDSPLPSATTSSSWTNGSIPLYAVTLAILLLFFLKRTSGKTKGRPLPGPRGLPIIGSTLEFLFSKLDPREIHEKWAKEYGEIFMYKLLGSRFVFLNNPDIIREVYAAGNHVHDRIPILLCNKALGRSNTDLGIVGCKADLDWKNLRKFVQHVLRNFKSYYSSFEPVVASQATRLVDEFSSHKGKPFEPQGNIYATVANITTTIVMGKTYEYEDQEFVALVKTSQDIFDYLGALTNNYHIPLVASVPVKSNRNGYRSISKLFRFIRDTVDETRRSLDIRKKTTESEQNIVQSFLEQQKLREKEGKNHVFTDPNLFQTVFDLCFAGFDTVSCSICWIIRLLSHHRDVQEKLQAELDDVVGRDRMPLLSDGDDLPFVMATIAECYRISRMISTQLPHVVDSDCEVRGYHVPKGSFVSVNASWLACNEATWEDPEVFRPERFIDDTGSFDVNLENKMMKFGVGRRICVGEHLARTELFVIMTHLLHRFIYEEVTPFSMGCTGTLVLHPLPFEIRAIPRG
ncbi:cytochrome P450 2D14-like [Lytechinus pictus]|uniref:cytochrome P450 2D14-like n=1 Tax=Lytechinus pictus TaxID=7653 RepID=UPI00240E0FBE|nr:cytochrome P450 2D14-like [Lytechinus pictus]